MNPLIEIVLRQVALAPCDGAYLVFEAGIERIRDDKLKNKYPRRSLISGGIVLNRFDIC